MIDSNIIVFMFLSVVMPLPHGALGLSMIVAFCRHTHLYRVPMLE